MSGYEVKITSTNADMFNNSEQYTSSDLWETDSVTSEDWDRSRGSSYVHTQTGHVKTVSTVDDIKDTDMVTVMGIPMTYKQAREVGFASQIEGELKASSKAFDEKDSTIRSEIAAEKEAQSQEERRKSLAVETKTSTYKEMNSGELLAGTLGMHSDFDAESVAHLAADTVLGQVQDSDENFRHLAEKGLSKQGWNGLIDQHKKIAQDVARSELGYDKYTELQAMAKQSATINKWLVEYAIQRAMGKATLNYDQVYRTCLAQSKK